MKKIIFSIYLHFNSHRYFYLLSFGTWTVLSIFMTFQLYSRFLVSGRNPGFINILVIEFTFCYLWLLLSPFILKLSYLLSFDRKHWLISSIAHFIAALIGSMITLDIRKITMNYMINPNENITLKSLFDAVYYALDYGIMSYLLIAFFSYTYKYYSNFKERELKTAQLESELLQSQLLALKIQIQPHFLFNTLNSITALIRKKENDKAIEMVSGLGKFLRYTLDKNNSQLVPLCEELEMMKTYLEIQQIRFNDRLNISYLVEPGIESAMVPNLLLQPIIENSIKHGISKITDAGEINIAASRMNGSLYLAVSDNGPGFNNNLSSTGIGLLNVTSRLEKLYGTNYTLKISNKPESGAQVEINIPFTNE